MHKHILNECSSMGGIVKKRSRGSRRSFFYNPLKMNPNFNINYFSLWRLFSFHSWHLTLIFKNSGLNYTKGKLLKAFLEKSPNVHLKIMKSMLLEDHFGNAAFSQGTKLQTIKKFVNLAKVPDYILTHMCTSMQVDKKVNHSSETKVLIKASQRNIFPGHPLVIAPSLF